MSDFLALLSKSLNASATDVLLFVALLVGILVVGSIAQYIVHHLKEGTFKIPAGTEMRTWYPHAIAALLLILAIPSVLSQLPESQQAFLATINSSQLNRNDEEVLERGYYESLLEPTDYLSALWSAESQRPAGWNTQLSDVGASRDTNTILLNVLIPNVETRWKDISFKTNQWGMRDKEYTKQKPENVYRYALLGASTEMGWGVAGEDVFEAIAEKKMNDSRSDTDAAVEILNFSVPSYTILQSIKQLDTVVGDFDVDEIFLVAHGNYKRRLFDVIGRANEAGIDLEYDYLKDLMIELEIDGTLTRNQLFSKIDSQFENIVRWGYSRAADHASANNAKVSILYVPTLGGSRADNASFAEVEKLAAEFGFAVHDLRGSIGDFDEAELEIAPWDKHPNKKAHRLIADEVVSILQAQE